MKVFIEDIVNDIYIKDQTIDFGGLRNIIKEVSNNKLTEIKLYRKSISQYLIQFYPVGIENWKLDYPIKLREVHKQCYATKEQCLAIVRELFEKGNIDDIPGFIDVPIQDFTLDEMIEFQKEEEMMLRGEDPFVEEEEKEDLATETVVPQEKKEIIKQPETKANIKIPKKAPIKKDSKSDNYFQI